MVFVPLRESNEARFHRLNLLSCMKIVVADSYSYLSMSVRPPCLTAIVQLRTARVTCSEERHASLTIVLVRIEQLNPRHQTLRRQWYVHRLAF